MSVNAIAAQGTKLYVGSGTGSAVTITGVSLAYKAVITGTHALAKGDRVTIAGIAAGSLASALNGNSFVVLDVTSTTSFVIDADTRGLSTWVSGGTATPVTWTQIKELKSFKPSGASAPKIDVTDLDSTSKEYLTGMGDNGTFTCDMHYKPTDAGQIALRAAFAGGASKPYKLVDPIGGVMSFAASITKWVSCPDATADGVLMFSAEFTFSGSVTVS
jgi:predicted secreted protein